MKTIKRIASVFTWIMLAAIWLWYLFVQIPVMLVAGMPDQAFAFAFLALSATVVGVTAYNYIKGKFQSNQKETAT